MGFVLTEFRNRDVPGTSVHGGGVVSLARYEAMRRPELPTTYRPEPPEDDGYDDGDAPGKAVMDWSATMDKGEGEGCCLAPPGHPLPRCSSPSAQAAGEKASFRVLRSLCGGGPLPTSLVLEESDAPLTVTPTSHCSAMLTPTPTAL